MDAPSHYFMGQIQQESRCDEGVTAFDGGMGLGQFMPVTADWIQKTQKTLREISDKPMPYDPKWAIRALVLYDKGLYKEAVCHEWYFAFRSYNGGVGLMNREIARAGSCEPKAVEAVCKRKVIKLKSGKPLDMCKVNIDYPYQIFKYAERYK